MQHLVFAKQNSSRHDIEKRLSGRFYTPLEICKALAQQSVAVGMIPKTVIDPFCGDGRLIVTWLKAAVSAPESMLHKLEAIHLWDCDAEAVSQARLAVCMELEKLELHSVQVHARCCDTFLASMSDDERFDFVITNPPWDLLKPDSRDAIQNGAEYRNEMRSYANRLASSFPEANSKKNKAIAGYGLNLARVGALASVQRLVAGGTLSIILPASMFADQASEPFRRKLFESINIKNLDYYPAETKLFSGVDQPFVTLIGTAGSTTDEILLSRMKNAYSASDTRKVKIESHLGQHIALGVGGAAEAIITGLSRTHPPLQSLTDDLRFGLWLGRELDETRIAEAFIAADKGVPFLKGRDIERYSVTSECTKYVDPSMRKIPRTVNQARLAWRDVSRPSQKRRVQATLLPKGTVTGNSLGVAFFHSGPHNLLNVLLAIFNSIVFEVQVRAQLATAHVSQGVLRKCVVPWAAFENPYLSSQLSSLVSARMSNTDHEPALEILVARSYGIKRDDFSGVLDSFEKISQAEKSILLSKELWE